MVDNPIHHDVDPSEPLTPEGELFAVMENLLLSPDAVTVYFPQPSGEIAEKIIVIEEPVEDRLFLLRARYGKGEHNNSLDVYFIRARSVGKISLYDDPAKEDEYMEAFQVHSQYTRRREEWVTTGGFLASRDALDLQAGPPPLPPRDIDNNRLKEIVNEIKKGKVCTDLTNIFVRNIKEQSWGVSAIRPTNMSELTKLPFKPRPRVRVG